MADTRQEIFENVKAAFALIQTASGYNFTIKHADIGFKHFSALPEDMFPALLVAGANEKRVNATNLGFTSDMQLSVVGYIKSSDANDPAVLERDLNKFLADTTKALYADPTRGGHSTFTEITAVITDKGAFQPYAMFELMIDLEYRATFAQP